MNTYSNRLLITQVVKRKRRWPLAEIPHSTPNWRHVCVNCCDKSFQVDIIENRTEGDNCLLTRTRTSAEIGMLQTGSSAIKNPVVYIHTQRYTAPVCVLITSLDSPRYHFYGSTNSSMLTKSHLMRACPWC